MKVIAAINGFITAERMAFYALMYAQIQNLPLVLLLGAMAMEFLWIWMLLGFEPVQNVFHTAYIPPGELWILLPFPIILFVSHEFYKWRKRVQKGLV